MVSRSGNKSVVVIEQASSTEAGEYLCKAVNKAGIASAVMQLDVLCKYRL